MVSPSATERRVTSSLPVAAVESVPPVPPSPESAQPDTAARAAVSGCALSGDGGTGGTDSTSATGREEVTLLSVADGDTITVRTAGGAKEKIRYIGMDAPEMAGDGEPAEPFALEAAAFNRGLVTGRDLRLKRGVEKRDDYGRLLAYIYAGDIFVNREMVRTGYARAHAYPPNLKYQKELDAAETEARRERVGIWGLAPDGGPDNGGNAGGAGSSGSTESGAAGTEAGVVPWNEAAGYVGESVTVEGPVVGTHWALHRHTLPHVPGGLVPGHNSGLRSRCSRFRAAGRSRSSGISSVVRSTVRR